MTDNRDTAVRLATAGIYVFQADPETKAPFYTIRAASNHPAMISQRWAGRPEALPAVAIGKSGLFVLDLDVGHREGENGIEAFSALVAEHGFPDDVPAVRSPRGGVHLYTMQRDDDPYLANRYGSKTPGLPNGIDFLVDPRNAFTIGPDAVLATGEFYEPIAGTPDLAEAYAAGAIPEVPAWIIDLIDAAVAADIEEQTMRCAAHGVAADASDSRRRAWSLGALEREAARLAVTAVGGRNHALNRAAYVLGGHAPTIAYGEAYDALYGACVANGYVTSRAAGDGPKQFKRTFNSGWRDGTAKPLPGPRDAPDPFAGQEIRPKIKPA